jgi:outer membrane immunogenic protein
MKKFLVGTVALVALGLGGTSAMAADMPVYKAAPLPVWTWAGVYFGAHAGGGWGRTDAWTSDFNCAVGNLCDTPGNQRIGGWVVGGQGGARWQWGGWVVGLEASLAATRIIGNDPSTCTPGVNTCIGIPGGFDVHHETLLSTLYTATAQIGYAFNRTLWYVKGGWAGGEVRRQSSDVLGPAPATTFFGGETRQATGWTVGTGIEYLVLQNLSLGVEYDYFRLHASAYNVNALSGTGAPGFRNFASDVRLDVHQVVARANYRLDWGVLWGGPAPVAARY